MGKEVTIFDGGDKRLTGVSESEVRGEIYGGCCFQAGGKNKTRNRRIRITEVEYEGIDMLRPFEEMIGLEWMAIHWTTDALSQQAEMQG